MKAWFCRIGLFVAVLLFVLCSNARAAVEVKLKVFTSESHGSSGQVNKAMNPIPLDEYPTNYPMIERITPETFMVLELVIKAVPVEEGANQEPALGYNIVVLADLAQHKDAEKDYYFFTDELWKIVDGPVAEDAYPVATFFDSHEGASMILPLYQKVDAPLGRVNFWVRVENIETGNYRWYGFGFLEIVTEYPEEYHPADW